MVVFHPEKLKQVSYTKGIRKDKYILWWGGGAVMGSNENDLNSEYTECEVCMDLKWHE